MSTQAQYDSKYQYKHLMTIGHNFLLNYCNSPHATTKASPVSLILKRDLHTTFDLLKPSAVKDIVLCHQEKQTLRKQQAKDRVFTSGESVLRRNSRGEPQWVQATVIAQTGPVSYTDQTTDSVWRRHVDQLLHTPSVPAELSLGESSGSPTPVHLPALVQNSATPETKAPAADMPVNGTETPPCASALIISSPLQDTNVPSDRRYPARERRPPKCVHTGLAAKINKETSGAGQNRPHPS